MNEKRLKITISLMSLAVVGLVGVQIYWITKSVEIEREQFSVMVNDALTNVAKKIEKEETATVIIKRISEKDKNETEECDTIDSSDQDVYLIDKNSEKLLTTIDVKTVEQPASPKLPVKPDSLLSRRLLELDVATILANTEHIVIESINDSLIARRITLFNDVVEQLIIRSKNQSTVDRLSNTNINYLLNLELKSKGIDLDFEFAVHDQKNDSLYFISTPELEEQLLNTEFKSRLFPDDLFYNASFLLLHFPDQKFYFIKSVQTLLILSLGLILLIVGIFFQTARALIRQKKITEIKNDLINNITHEFKTPLSTISLTCEALKEPEIIGNKITVERYSNIIASEKDRLQQMVEALLNTAMFERDKLKLNLEDIDLHDLIINEGGKYKFSLERLNGKIKYELKAGQFKLKVDKFHFQNVISNLIDNAIKYCENKPDITLETYNENKSVVITVIDNGIGISRKNKDKVFDTFYRVPTGNIQNVKGFGIGLSYAKKIVEAHHGRIAINSSIGRGTKVTIILPLDRN